VVAVSVAVGPGERGRVPFALVGVVLLVGSATFAATVERGTHRPEPAVDAVMERAAADARSAVRRAVARASVAAASDPVVEPAETPYGRVLDADAAFEDSLRIRIYRTVAGEFRSLDRRRRGVEATVSVPPVDSPGSMADAIERVNLSRAGPDRAKLAVQVRNVTVTARRGDRVVGRRTLRLRVRVDTPVLAVHDRVETYADRLRAGYDDPGLARQVTGRLYAVAWARGYAQYGGAPIANVVANRHVGLLTNGALLDVQRSVFGRSDPDSRRAYRVAFARTGVADLLAAGSERRPSLEPLAEQVVRTTPTVAESTGRPDRLAVPGSRAPRPSDPIEVRVGPSADEAFADLLLTDRMNETLQSVYSASVRTVAATETVEHDTPSPPGPPGPGWTVAGSWTETKTDARTASESTPDVSVPSGYHRLETYAHVVDVERTRVRTWRRGNATATTRSSATSRVRTTVALVGRHAQTRHAPRNGIETVHERAGRFDGPNLVDIDRLARDRLVESRGGPGGLAGRAAVGNLNTSARTVEGELPPGIYDWVYRDVAALRERVRGMAVAVERGRLGTYTASPAAKLVRRLRSERAALLDAPGTYPAAPEKARVAARGRYLRAVIGRLEARAAARDERAARLDGRLQEAGGPSLDGIRDALAARRVDRPEPADTGPTFRVDGAPPYLTLGALDHEQVPAIEPDESVHPLAVRNVNVASLPYADVANGILDAVLSGAPKTNLRTAAKALRTANRTLERGGNATLTARRDELRRRTSASIDGVRRELRTVLDRREVGSRSLRRAILDDVLGRWETVHGRALAVANGAVAAAVARAAGRRAPDDLDSQRAVDSLRIDLRTSSDAAVGTDGQVAGPVVNRTTAAVTAVGRAHLEAAAGEATKRGLDRATERQWGKTLARLPAGIPITPVPGHWYATANAWTVTVRGEYERFAVETPRATATATDASLHYVREGDPVAVDVDDDGRPERLGNSTRMRFGIETVVVVVVPPYGTGVGDVDGSTVETSKGWPVPGPEKRTLEDWPVRASGWANASDPPGRERGSG
jgi:hypothetical protein